MPTQHAPSAMRRPLCVLFAPLSVIHASPVPLLLSLPPCLPKHSKSPLWRGRHKCHTVTACSDTKMPHLWHFGPPPDTNFMPHCDMQIRYEMSQCHSFQLRKNVFSYEKCDIVTSRPLRRGRFQTCPATPARRRPTNTERTNQ